MDSYLNTDKICVLIVDGFSNHNWLQTSNVVKSILEKHGTFDVSISTMPSKVNSKEWTHWNPKFKNFDVIIQNTNNVHNKDLRWPKRIKKRLERYLKSGGGLYVLHSANNAFADWKAYNQMIGLGWRSKNEGIALRIEKNGEIKHIPLGEGESTSHDERSDQVIYILNNHPINKDFPKAWKTHDIELYKYARGPAKNLTILSYAQDNKTEINWPVV
nr:ThuA domain-containing protein [uncultured Allomuricauda sp.]